jgi:hypothetical protein
MIMANHRLLRPATRGGDCRHVDELDPTLAELGQYVASVDANRLVALAKGSMASTGLTRFTFAASDRVEQTLADAAAKAALLWAPSPICA